MFRNKDLKNQVRNLSRFRKEKLELNTRVLDLEKQIYETCETYKTYETQAEDELKKGKQVNPRYALDMENSEFIYLYLTTTVTQGHSF